MRRSTTLLALALLSLGGLPSTHSSAQAPSSVAPSAAHLAQLLSGFEDMPSDQSLRAMGPATVGALAALYNDASQPPYVRLRSVAAAGAFHTPAAHTFLRAVVTLRGQGDLFVREGLLSLGRAFGEAATLEIAPFLERPESVVREAAVISLGRIHSPRAIAALRARLDIESDLGVLRKLRASLNR
ncbi:MAG: HEAT repeat domain-containing protein [Deltaproteobacteria bacterium]|nr:HEAT repeat domain-containing protein [Deltaproteobacteria bacterium]